MAPTEEEGKAATGGEPGDTEEPAAEEPSNKSETPAEELHGGPRRRKGRPSRSPGARRGNTGSGDPFEKVEQLMLKREFRQAEVVLNGRLGTDSEDDRAMHYLGVLLTEECRFAEAEVQFQGAFDRQEKLGKVNQATAFGLATVLTELGGTEKLLQGEALFRDCLENNMKQEADPGDTYRTFAGLAENFGRQKRWGEAAEAWTSVVKFAERMFGEDNERTKSHKAALARAERLGRLQWYFRGLLWVATGATVIWASWSFAQSGMAEALLGHIRALATPHGAGSLAEQEAAAAAAPTSGEL